MDEAPVLFHQTIHHRQPETGAHTGWLGGEEWLKHPRLRRLIHASPSIADREIAKMSWLDPRMQRSVFLAQRGQPDFGMQRPTLWHRVARVCDEIQQDLLQRDRICHDEAVRVGDVETDLDTRWQQATH